MALRDPQEKYTHAKQNYAQQNMRKHYQKYPNYLILNTPKQIVGHPPRYFFS